MILSFLKRSVIYFLTLSLFCFFITYCKKVPIPTGHALLTDHCSDKIQDGDETGIDCGGTECDPCPVSVPCSPPADQMSGLITTLNYTTVVCTNSSGGSIIKMQGCGCNIYPTVFFQGSLPGHDVMYSIVSSGTALSANTVHFSLYDTGNSTNHYSNTGDGSIYLTYSNGKPIVTFCSIFDPYFSEHVTGKMVCP